MDREKVRNEPNWLKFTDIYRLYCQDTFKISGKQVSPTEIENTIREHPSQLVTDVAVAGVEGERLPDELVPRAWVVLSSTGKQRGIKTVLTALDEWTRSRLSKHKWLRGGLQVVDEVSNWHVRCYTTSDVYGTY